MIINFKGGKKCFGVLLALSITFLVSLGHYSDTSAYRYTIDKFDMFNNDIRFTDIDENKLGRYSVQNYFGIDFSSTSDIPSNFNFPHTWQFNGNYDTLSGVCHLLNYTDGVYQDGTHFSVSSNPTPGYNDDFLYGMTGVSPLTDDWWTQTNLNNLCFIKGHSFNESSSTTTPLAGYPDWDWSSLINIPLVNERRKYELSKPYTYQFDGGALTSVSTSDGIILESDGLDMSTIFNTEVPKFKQLTMPFTLFSDSTNRIDWVDDDGYDDVHRFQIDGRITFTSDFTLSSDSKVYLDVTNYYNPTILSGSKTGTLFGKDFWNLDQDTVSSLIECTLNERHDDLFQLFFHCSYDTDNLNVPSDIHFNLLSTKLVFTSNSGDFLSTTGDYRFEKFFITTNNNPDINPAGISSATGMVTGGNVDGAPGVDYPNSDAVADWFTSLKNMFTFNFFNPFAPIFSMFTDNSSCADIPIIAGMIHSEETQVCPWFDSTTRNIVTPVLGLSAMMLVFGFAVRWLGARSGNFVEDSGGVDSGNFHFENKYRRKK